MAPKLCGEFKAQTLPTMVNGVEGTQRACMKCGRVTAKTPFYQDHWVAKEPGGRAGYFKCGGPFQGQGSPVLQVLPPQVPAHVAQGQVPLPAAPAVGPHQQVPHALQGGSGRDLQEPTHSGEEFVPHAAHYNSAQVVPNAAQYNPGQLVLHAAQDVTDQPSQSAARHGANQPLPHVAQDVTGQVALHAARHGANQLLPYAAHHVTGQLVPHAVQYSAAQFVPHAVQYGAAQFVPHAGQYDLGQLEPHAAQYHAGRVVPHAAGQNGYQQQVSVSQQMLPHQLQLTAAYDGAEQQQTAAQACGRLSQQLAGLEVGHPSLRPQTSDSRQQAAECRGQLHGGTGQQAPATPATATDGSGQQGFGQRVSNDLGGLGAWPDSPFNGDAVDVYLRDAGITSDGEVQQQPQQHPSTAQQEPRGAWPSPQQLPPPSAGILPPSAGISPPSAGILPPTAGILPPSAGIFPPAPMTQPASQRPPVPQEIPPNGQPGAQVMSQRKRRNTGGGDTRLDEVALEQAGSSDVAVALRATGDAAPGPAQPACGASPSGDTHATNGSDSADPYTWPCVVAALTGDWSDELKAGQRLQQGQCLRSSNGSYTLEMQDDGNLVLYKYDRLQRLRTPIWKSDTYRTCGGPFYLDMQRDGNLVCHRHGHIKMWSYDTWNDFSSSKPRAHLQDDGNLVVYDSHGERRGCTRDGDL